MNKFIRTVLFSLFLLVVASAPGHAVPVTFVYTDAAGEGFNHPTLGATRKATFQAAANYFATTLSGTVPLVISAKFEAQGGTPTSAVLAYASPTDYKMNWIGAKNPQPDTWYAIGLANQLAGRDLDNTKTDIEVVFNSDVDGDDVLENRNFYYGTDGNSGNNIDFYSVALHELGHGLGFLSTQAPDGTYYGTISIYDRFLKQGSLSLSTATAVQRQEAIVSGALVFDGPFANAGNGGSPAKIYAPDPYEGGSSVSHVDEATYTGPNELMTPASSGVAHKLGPVASGIFKDIGWEIVTPSDPEQSGGTLVVNTTDDHNDSSCSTGDCTLREAIDQANYLSGTQTITFNVAAGNQQITLKSGLPIITDALVVQGPTTQRITISGNNAYRVFYTGASLTLQNLSVINGSATNSVGAGLFVGIASGSRAISITNCTFSGNSASQGGGIAAFAAGGSGSLNLTGSTFSGNSAVGDGGAIFVYSNTASSSLAVSMTGCTVSGNTSSDWGAGLELWQAAGNLTASLSNSTFSGNSATNYGGALISYSGASITADSVTIAGNTSGFGAAAGVFANSSFTSRNSLYAGNTSSSDGISMFNTGTVTSQGNNQFSDNPAGFTAAGDLKNQSNLASTLGALAENGGPTRTRALLAGSPAINAGSTTLTVDQRGSARPQGGAADVGAFEVAPPNTAPTISVINDQTAAENTATAAIPFIIGDAETPVGSLALTGTSSNTTLVPNANIAFGGSGANRTVTITPAANQSGSATITITVTDGAAASALRTFSLTVLPAPTITGFTPTQGAIGATVIINGTGFTSASEVRFNGVASVYTVNSSTEITATVPAGATTGLISVKTAGGTATSATPFTVIAGDSTPPTVTVTAPANGTAIK